jgi:ferrous iron transport protein B
MLTIYFPCIATFAIMVKELGVKDMIKASIVMIFAASFVGIILRFVLLGV